MKKQIMFVALLLAGLFVFSASSAQAQERRFFYGPRVGVRVYVAPPVVAYPYPYGYTYVAPAPVAVMPQVVYFGQVPVAVTWYPEFGCYGYYWNNVFFGWNGGHFMRGYGFRGGYGYRGYRR